MAVPASIERRQIAIVDTHVHIPSVVEVSKQRDQQLGREARLGDDHPQVVVIILQRTRATVATEHGVAVFRDLDEVVVVHVEPVAQTALSDMLECRLVHPPRLRREELSAGGGVLDVGEQVDHLSNSGFQLFWRRNRPANSMSKPRIVLEVFLFDSFTNGLSDLGLVCCRITPHSLSNPPALEHSLQVFDVVSVHDKEGVA
mmetsp:Transcript_11253/g.30134  ORF Transcript_11253/g.30134 Transcript_11253/m.30134 type:complete len:201 (+) Transcript_11253:771-1373(+)